MCGRLSDVDFCNFVAGQTDGDQTRLVVGVVVGLLVAAVVLGLAYWVYMKKSKYVTLEHYAGSDSFFNCLVVWLSYI